MIDNEEESYTETSESSIQKWKRWWKDRWAGYRVKVKVWLENHGKPFKIGSTSETLISAFKSRWDNWWLGQLLKCVGYIGIAIITAKPTLKGGQNEKGL